MKAETVAFHDYKTREELEKAIRVWISIIMSPSKKKPVPKSMEYRISTTESKCPSIGLLSNLY